MDRVDKHSSSPAPPTHKSHTDEPELYAARAVASNFRLWPAGLVYTCGYYEKDFVCETRGAKIASKRFVRGDSGRGGPGVQPTLRHRRAPTRQQAKRAPVAGACGRPNSKRLPGCRGRRERRRPPGHFGVEFSGKPCHVVREPRMDTAHHHYSDTNEHQLGRARAAGQPASRDCDRQRFQSGRQPQRWRGLVGKSPIPRQKRVDA